MAVETIGADTANSRGTSVSPSGSAHTKGAWTQLVAASAEAAAGVLLVISGGAASSTENYLIDLGVGGSGAEVVTVADLPHAGPTTRLLSTYFLPVAIAAGSRIAVRCQCGAAGAGAIFVMAYLLPAVSVGLQQCTTVTTYGASPGTTRGTSIDPGGATNTKGAWTEIVAATSRPIDWIVPLADNLGDTAQSVCEWLVDVGTGAGGAESVVIANLQFQATALTDLKVPQAYPALPIPRIDAGTRLAARAQCNSATAGDRLLGLILLGADGTASGGGGSLSWTPLTVLAGAGAALVRSVVSGSGPARG